MLFRLTNALATYQALINNVLRAHLDLIVIAYLDNILIYSENKKEYIQYVQDVLKYLSRANLLLKPKKYRFYKEQVEFLRYIVGINGIQVSPEKIATTREQLIPRIVKDVRSFLGFTGFNRQFIEKYSKRAIPLTEITKKEKGFQWGKEQQTIFKDLKEAYISPLTLCSFRVNELARIKTNALDLAVRAYLCQKREEKWHPIAYFSRKISVVEQNYDIYNKELLAVVSALEQ